MTKAEFTVDGMQCEGCAARLQTVLAREPGVRNAKVGFEARRAEAAFNPETVVPERLEEIIEAAGFRVVETAP